MSGGAGVSPPPARKAPPPYPHTAPHPPQTGTAPPRTRYPRGASAKLVRTNRRSPLASITVQLAV